MRPTRPQLQREVAYTKLYVHSLFTRALACRGCSPQGNLPNRRSGIVSNHVKHRAGRVHREAAAGGRHIRGADNIDAFGDLGPANHPGTTRRSPAAAVSGDSGGTGSCGGGRGDARGARTAIRRAPGANRRCERHRQCSADPYRSAAADSGSSIRCRGDRPRPGRRRPTPTSWASRSTSCWLSTRRSPTATGISGRWRAAGEAVVIAAAGVSGPPIVRPGPAGRALVPIVFKKRKKFMSHNHALHGVVPIHGAYATVIGTGAVVGRGLIVTALHVVDPEPAHVFTWMASRSPRSPVFRCGATAPSDIWRRFRITVTGFSPVTISGPLTSHFSLSPVSTDTRCPCVTSTCSGRERT